MCARSTRGPRDPEDRKIDESDLVEKKDKMMDKTVADTFPASDPPSSIPDPDQDSFAGSEAELAELEFDHSSVTDFTRLRGRSTSKPFLTAM